MAARRLAGGGATVVAPVAAAARPARPRPPARALRLVGQHHVAARRGLAPVAAALVLACACSSPAPRTPDPDAAFRAQLGRDWALVRLGTREIPPPPGTRTSAYGDPIPGQRPTIRFAAEPPGAGGRTFCNGYGAPYVQRGDSLRLGPIESSAVGCDGPDSLETRFHRALLGTRRFELDSARLVLVAGDGTRLTFAPASAAEIGPRRREGPGAP